MAKKKRARCTACRGRGYRYNGYYDQDGFYRYTTIYCPVCSGTGIKPDTKETAGQ